MKTYIGNHLTYVNTNSNSTTAVHAINKVDSPEDTRRNFDQETSVSIITLEMHFIMHLIDS